MYYIDTMVRKIKVVDVGETQNNTIEQVQTPEPMQEVESTETILPLEPVEPVVMKKPRDTRPPRVKK